MELRLAKAALLFTPEGASWCLTWELFSRAKSGYTRTREASTGPDPYTVPAGTGRVGYTRRPLVATDSRTSIARAIQLVHEASRKFLQGVSIALLCKPCTSYRREPSVRLSVRLSLTLWH